MADHGEIRVAGAWETADAFHARVSGAWEECDECWARISGAWKQFHSGGAADPTLDGVCIVRNTSGAGACAAGKCNSCVYWTVLDGLAGDTVDVATALGGGSFVNIATGVAYDVDSTRCTSYSLTGDAQDTTCDSNASTLEGRVTLYRSAVQKDQDQSGTAANCGDEAGPCAA